MGIITMIIAFLYWREEFFVKAKNRKFKMKNRNPCKFKYFDQTNCTLSNWSKTKKIMVMIFYPEI